MDSPSGYQSNGYSSNGYQQPYDNQYQQPYDNQYQQPPQQQPAPYAEEAIYVSNNTESAPPLMYRNNANDVHDINDVALLVDEQDLKRSDMPLNNDPYPVSPPGSPGGASYTGAKFRDPNKKRYELALCYPNHLHKHGDDEDPEHNHQKRIQRRDAVITKLMQVGLTIDFAQSQDAKDTFVLITATNERLEEQAEILEIELRLKPEFGGGYCPFRRDKKHMFKTREEDGKFFRLTRRQQLIQNIIEGDCDLRGAETDLAELVLHGVFDKAYPLHANGPSKNLVENFVKKPRAKLPIQEVRQYFGEEISFYFDWLSFYTRWLLYPAIPGVICFIISETGAAGDWANSAYSVIIAIWATLFLEFWKRQRNIRVREWNVYESAGIETTRPGYKGEEKLGVWVHGEFIELQPDEVYGVIPPKPIKYFSTDTVRKRMLFGVSIVAVMAMVVVIATAALLTVRFWLTTPWNSIVGGIMNAMSIMILNMLYRKVAVMLNDWENHRTTTSYENNLIIKIFLFQFVNSYTSLYYIAFVKRGNVLWGRFHDKCAYGDPNEEGVGCPRDLMIQLLIILLTNIIVGQAQEVLIPWFTTKLKWLWFSHTTHISDKVSKYEKQKFLSDYVNTIDDYGEMVIQYGYITLFAAAFPLAPLLALVNNHIEMHTDMFKMLVTFNKPFYRETDGIGIWYDILEVIGVIGVITNCLLIGFSFRDLAQVLPAFPFSALLVIVVLEHVVLFGKFLFSILIPDMPSAMKKQVAKQHYIRQELFKKFKNSSLA